MVMSINSERFITMTDEKNLPSKDDQDNPLRTCTRQTMLKFLNRVMDRNKPLFLFNSKVNDNLQE